MQQYKYNEKWKYLSRGCLNITDACNLACHYCFVQQQPHFMTLQTAKDSADFFYNNYIYKLEHKMINEFEYPELNFFGGEPTLLWDDIIVPLTQYIKDKYGKKFKLGITSNCTLLSKERVDFLFKNNISLLTSVDGDKNTQDLTRPCQDKTKSSFDMVMKNLPYILEVFPHSVFRATLNQENVSKMFENYLWAEQLGFRNYFFSPNEREKWSNENLEILKEQVSNIFYQNTLYFLNNLTPPLMSSQIDDGYRHAIMLINHNLNNIEHSKIQEVPMERCGIGTGTCSINYEGKIFCCQEQDSRNDTNDIFCIGDIYNGIDVEKQKKITKMYLEPHERTCEDPAFCEECKNINTCYGDICPSTCADIFHNFYTKTKIICYFKNLFTNNALAQMQLMSELNNETFFNYLRNLDTFKRGRGYNGYK